MVRGMRSRLERFVDAVRPSRRNINTRGTLVIDAQAIRRIL